MTSIWMSAGVVPVRHRISALVLVSVLGALVSLAHVTPPDQTELTGFYDAWDFDEVVVAVVSASAIVRSISLLSPKPVDTPAGIARAADAAFVAAASVPRFHTRSPPGEAPW